MSARAMADESFDIRSLKRDDGLRRGHSVYGVFHLIARIEEFRGRPGMRNSEGMLAEAYRGLKSAILDPGKSESSFISNPGMHVTPEFALAAAERRADPKPRIRLDARLNQSGNLSMTFSTDRLCQDGRWRHADEWNCAPERTYFRGERPDNEVLYVKGVSELIYHAGSETHLTQPDWWDEEFALASQAVLAACEQVTKRLSDRFKVQQDMHVAGIFGDDSLRAKCLGLEIVHGLTEHRATLSNVASEFSAETGIAAETFWHMFGSGKHSNPTAESESVSRRIRSRGGPSSGLTPSGVRNWRTRLERAARHGLWTVPPATDEQVVALARLEHHRAALAEEKSTRKPGMPTPTHGGAVLPDDVRAEFGVEDVHSLAKLLDEARTSNGLRPMPQGDYPSNKANLARAVRALRTFREEAEDLHIPSAPGAR